MDCENQAPPLTENATVETTKTHRSFFDRLVATEGHNIQKLKAKDTTGRWAYYFVLVSSPREHAFLEAIEGGGNINLEDYGHVIASCYGEEPTGAVKEYLKDKYGFDV